MPPPQKWQSWRWMESLWNKHGADFCGASIAWKDQLTRELASIYAMVEHFRDSDGSCPTCAIADQVAFPPRFQYAGPGAL